jgi:hypothetical protein
MVVKCKNDELFVMPLKYVLSVMDLVNQSGTPKLWALKRKNDEFLATPLKNVLSLMGLVNHPRTPKLLAIVHKNGPKMQKQRVFGHASQKCTESHGPCKSPQNPKTMDNSS